MEGVSFGVLVRWGGSLWAWQLAGRVSISIQWGIARREQGRSIVSSGFCSSACDATQCLLVQCIRCSTGLCKLLHARKWFLTQFSVSKYLTIINRNATSGIQISFVVIVQLFSHNEVVLLQRIDTKYVILGVLNRFLTCRCQTLKLGESKDDRPDLSPWNVLVRVEHGGMCQSTRKTSPYYSNLRNDFTPRIDTSLENK